jgi:hypothetical protein
MVIHEFKLTELSSLTLRTYVCELEGKWSCRALILEFSGKYRYGSEGNADADFIEAMKAAAVAYIGPEAIVYDFRGMSYEWGNRIWNVLPTRYQAGSEETYLPTAMVVSEMSRRGFSTCAGMVPPMFDDLESALRRVEGPARQIVSELMGEG